MAIASLSALSRYPSAPYPHKFRHTFATRALSAGVDVNALKLALGHTTLAMVMRYIQYQKEDILAAWRKRQD